MADITATIAATSGFLPQVWAQRALDVLRQRIVMAKLVARDTDFEPGWVGQTLNIPYPGTFTAQSKSADTPATVQTPTGGATVSVTLNSHQYVDFIVEDFANAQANQQLMDRYVQPAVIALADKLETDLLGQYVNFTNTAVGTPGTDLTGSTIRAAMRALHNAKVPTGDRNLVISAKDEAALLGDSTLANYFGFSRPQDLEEGMVGRLFGFNIYWSQHLQNDISTNEVQTVSVTGTPTGGTYTLTFNGVASAAIAFNATAATVQTALQGISTIGSGNVTVSGSAGGPYTVTFTGLLAGTNQPALALGTNSLTGGTTPSVTVSSVDGATRNLAFHKNAILLATRPFRDPPPNSGVAVSAVVDPDSGLSIRAVAQYDVANRGVRVGYDILYGIVTLRPTLGLVVNT